MFLFASALMIACRSGHLSDKMHLWRGRFLFQSIRLHRQYLRTFSLCRSWGSDVLISQCLNLGWDCTQNVWKVLSAKERREFITPARQPWGELCSISSPSPGRVPLKREGSSGVAMVILGLNKTSWQQRAFIIRELRHTLPGTGKKSYLLQWRSSLQQADNNWQRDNKREIFNDHFLLERMNSFISCLAVYSSELFTHINQQQQPNSPPCKPYQYIIRQHIKSPHNNKFYILYSSIDVEHCTVWSSSWIGILY